MINDPRCKTRVMFDVINDPRCKKVSEMMHVKVEWKHKLKLHLELKFLPPLKMSTTWASLEASVDVGIQSDSDAADDAAQLKLFF